MKLPSVPVRDRFVGALTEAFQAKHLGSEMAHRRRGRPDARADSQITDGFGRDSRAR